ncbi:hypothetical protein D3C87_1509420 [compost metagenome]
MQRVLAAPGQRLGRVEQGGGKGGLAQRNAACRLAPAATANGVVAGVARVVVGDHGVGVVVAAVQKHADERLVVGGGKGRSLAHGGEVEGKWQRSACQAQLGGPAQKRAAGVEFGLKQMHGGLTYF